MKENMIDYGSNTPFDEHDINLIRLSEQATSTFRIMVYKQVDGVSAKPTKVIFSTKLGF